MRLVTFITVFLCTVIVGLCTDMAWDYITIGYGLHPGAAIGLSLIAIILAWASLAINHMELPEEQNY